MKPYISVETKFRKPTVFTYVDGNIRKPMSMDAAYKKHRTGLDLRVRSKGRQVFFGGPLDVKMPDYSGSVPGLIETPDYSGSVPGLIETPTPQPSVRPSTPAAIPMTKVTSQIQKNNAANKIQRAVRGRNLSKDGKELLNIVDKYLTKIQDSRNEKNLMQIVFPFPNGNAEDKRSMRCLYVLVCMTEDGHKYIQHQVLQKASKFGANAKKGMKKTEEVVKKRAGKAKAKKTRTGKAKAKYRGAKDKQTVTKKKILGIDFFEKNIRDVEMQMKSNTFFDDVFDDAADYKKTSGTASLVGWLNTFLTQPEPLIKRGADYTSGNPLYVDNSEVPVAVLNGSATTLVATEISYEALKIKCKCAWCGNYMKSHNENRIGQDNCTHTVELDHQIPKAHVGWLYICLAKLLPNLEVFDNPQTLKIFLDNMGGAQTSIREGFVYICTLCNQTKSDMMPYALTTERQITININCYKTFFSLLEKELLTFIDAKGIKSYFITKDIDKIKSDQRSCNFSWSTNASKCVRTWALQWFITNCGESPYKEWKLKCFKKGAYELLNSMKSSRVAALCQKHFVYDDGKFDTNKYSALWNTLNKKQEIYHIDRFQALLNKVVATTTPSQAVLSFIDPYYATLLQPRQQPEPNATKQSTSKWKPTQRDPPAKLTSGQYFTQKVVNNIWDGWIGQITTKPKFSKQNGGHTYSYLWMKPDNWPGIKKDYENITKKEPDERPGIRVERNLYEGSPIRRFISLNKEFPYVGISHERMKLLVLDNTITKISNEQMETLVKDPNIRNISQRKNTEDANITSNAPDSTKKKKKNVITFIQNVKLEFDGEGEIVFGDTAMSEFGRTTKSKRSMILTKELKKSGYVGTVRQIRKWYSERIPKNKKNSELLKRLLVETGALARKIN